MIRGWSAIYYREMLILRHRLARLIAAWSVSPLLYLVAFGYAMGKGITIQGHTYIEFLIPGLAAMVSMTQSFAIGSEINIARFYWHVFEEFQAAPISNVAFVLGEVLAGMTRALLAGCVILVLGASFGVVLSYSILFWSAFLLNSLIFSSLAVGLAMLIKSHADQAMLTSFVITPMAFLGGTFFPIEHLPFWAQKILCWLPLTHAANAIRASSFNEAPRFSDYLILVSLGILAFVFAVMTVTRARD
ncbi:MAG: ABC transporter permease [Deltaproteobacteria bacterium]|nr:ABC transporter permease [Deltaproteobacteria bacterium]MBW2132695.1 ABC transporter permease [Deltaproteobacteria bacterium]